MKADGAGVVAEQVYFARGLPNGIGGAVVVGDHLYGTEIASGEFVASEFATGKIKWKAPSIGRVSIASADG